MYYLRPAFPVGPCRVILPTYLPTYSISGESMTYVLNRAAGPLL